MTDPTPHCNATKHGPFCICGGQTSAAPVVPPVPPGETPTVEKPQPYRIWPMEMFFGKNGVPRLASSGQASTIRSVVIMDAETFKRLVHEPGLEATQWEVAQYDA